MADERRIEVPPDSNYDQPGRYGFWMEKAGDGRTFEDIIQSDDFLLLTLNPQQLKLSEPLATSVTLTQGGGKVTESRGMVIKHGTIAGTTGYIQPVRGQSNLAGVTPATGRGSKSLVDTSPAAQDSRAVRSGFREINRIKFLFRRYGALRQEGQQVRMHFMNFKDMEFWEIEPDTVDIQQTSRSPMTYSYTIPFKCLEPSYIEFQPTFDQTPTPEDLAQQDVKTDGFAIASPVTQAANLAVQQVAAGAVAGASLVATAQQSPLRSNPALRQAVTRLDTMRVGLTGGMRYLSGAIQIAMQGVIRRITIVFSVLDDVRGATVQLFLDTPLVVLKQLDTALIGAFEVIASMQPGALQNELNEWALEALQLTRSITAHYRVTYGDRPGSQLARENDKYTGARGEEGSTRDLIPQSGNLTSSPFLPTSGLSQVLDLQRSVRASSVRQATLLYGETIFDVASRLLGSVHRFVELVVLNDLEAPYVVASVSDKPPNTLAWGEKINIPDDATGSSLDAPPIEAQIMTAAGQVTLAGASNEVIDQDQVWEDDQWVGFTVTITSGALAGEQRVVVGNTADTLLVNRPWTSILAVSTGYRMKDEQFQLRTSPTDEEALFGRDILAVFSTGTTGMVLVNCLFSSSGDVATVAGLENFEQAIALLMSCPRGLNPLHRQYGVGMPIGQQWGGDLPAVYTYFMRQALLRDRRVDKVEHAQVDMQGDQYLFQAEVTPVKIGSPKLIRVAR